MPAEDRSPRQTPLSVIIVRIVVPLGILLTYWAIRLPRITSPTADANVGIEVFVALALTLIGCVVAASGLVALYRHIVR
ncbi:hypothetical protein ABZU76_27785 [Amycolatopsis sp. NPDC005232]|uniref:hypothetical protein n=1 Tax=Amycolatopsis sp. NPDC005232 TaxID=3157027 RepID=UPI0033B063EC